MEAFAGNQKNTFMYFQTRDKLGSNICLHPPPPHWARAASPHHLCDLMKQKGADHLIGYLARNTDSRISRGYVWDTSTLA